MEEGGSGGLINALREGRGTLHYGKPGEMGVVISGDWRKWGTRAHCRRKEGKATDVESTPCKKKNNLDCSTTRRGTARGSRGLVMGTNLS